MKIYFNWLGEWKALNNQSDNIEGGNPEKYVREILSNYKDISPMDIVQINKNETEYYIRAKDIVWEINHNTSSLVNEERW